MEPHLHKFTGPVGELLDAGQQGDETKENAAVVPAAGIRLARTPDRIPMIHLSPNATQPPAKHMSHLNVRARVPEVTSEAFPAYNLGSNTTCRNSHQAAPSRWRPGSSSGSMTARGELPIIIHLLCNHQVCHHAALSLSSTGNSCLA